MQIQDAGHSGERAIPPDSQATGPDRPSIGPMTRFSSHLPPSQPQARPDPGGRDHRRIPFAPVFADDRTRPTLKIQDGCDARCSFCVIPRVRGPSRSLDPERSSSRCGIGRAGYQEIVLSGINLGGYGRDLDRRINFLGMLERILRESSIARIRISSIEPMDVSPALIRLVARSRVWRSIFTFPCKAGATGFCGSCTGATGPGNMPSAYLPSANGFPTARSARMSWWASRARPTGPRREFAVHRIYSLHLPSHFPLLGPAGHRGGRGRLAGQRPRGPRAQSGNPLRSSAPSAMHSLRHKSALRSLP